VKLPEFLYNQEFLMSSRYMRLVFRPITQYKKHLLVMSRILYPGETLSNKEMPVNQGPKYFRNKVLPLL